MKGLDASLLLGLLEGDPSLRALLRELRGHEVAATEIAFGEIALRAAAAPVRQRAARRLALERLRRKLTVLSIDSRAVAEAARRAHAGSRLQDLPRLLEWGALEANGCDVLYTRHPSVAGSGEKWRLRVTRIRGR